MSIREICEDYKVAKNGLFHSIARNSIDFVATKDIDLSVLHDFALGAAVPLPIASRLSIC